MAKGVHREKNYKHSEALSESDKSFLNKYFFSATYAFDQFIDCYRQFSLNMMLLDCFEFYDNGQNVDTVDATQCDHFEPEQTGNWSLKPNDNNKEPNFLLK